MYFVYILLSEKDKRTYIGYTQNVEAGLHEHNSGRVTATKNRRPFKIILTEEFHTMSEAKQRELWWKGGTGRNKLKNSRNPRGCF